MKYQKFVTLLALSLFIVSCKEAPENSPQNLEKENIQETQVEPLLRKSNSAESVAKMKKIPSVLKRNGVDYKLVSVIEGEQATARFTLLLQESSKVKTRLQQLTVEFNKLGADTPAQKELVAAEINDSKKQYVAYLSDLAKNYGYSKEYNYILEPFECRYATGKEGEDVKLESAEAYLKLEQLRANYVQLVSSGKLDSEQQVVADELKQSLLEDYGFDIMENYTLYIAKAGLYGTGAKK